MRYLVGAGNWLMGDDGIGPRLVEACRDLGHAIGFSPVDIGNDGLRLLALFDPSTEKIVVVDCARMGRSPGDWSRFTTDEIASERIVDGPTTHTGDLLSVVELGRKTGLPVPPIVFVGIEPGSMEPSLELSPALSRRFDDYLDVLLAEIRDPAPGPRGGRGV